MFNERYANLNDNKKFLKYQSALRPMYSTVTALIDMTNNKPFPYYLRPLFQSESWCPPFICKLDFIHMQMKTNFHLRMNENQDSL